MDTLMRMQNSYDIAQARKREGDINVPRFTGKATEPQCLFVRASQNGGRPPSNVDFYWRAI